MTSFALPGISSTESLILDTMYQHGRGYGTSEIIASCINKDASVVRRCLSKLRGIGLVKVAKVSHYYVHVLTKQSIDMFGQPKYLQRMKQRHESLGVIYDKLLMLSFVGQHCSDSHEVIAPYDKVALLTQEYGFTMEELAPFTVRGSKEIFFNDVMYVNTDGADQNLHIVLFPRSEIMPRTYLKDFLIKQYAHLNKKISNDGRNVCFTIAVINEYLAEQYRSMIDHGQIAKEFKGDEPVCQLIGPKSTEMDAKTKRLYELKPYLKQTTPKYKHSVSLDEFNIQVTVSALPHRYFGG